MKFTNGSIGSSSSAALGEAPRRVDLARKVVRVAQERRLEVDEREPRVRAREAGIAGDGALEQRRRRGIVLAVEAVQVLQAEVIGGPGVEVFARR